MLIGRACGFANINIIITKIVNYCIRNKKLAESKRIVYIYVKKRESTGIEPVTSRLRAVRSTN